MLRFTSMTLVAALWHFAAFFTASMATFRSTMSRFDTGLPPSLTEQVLDHAATVLAFPLVTIYLVWQPTWMPGGYEIAILNSLIWGAAVAAIFLHLTRGKMSRAS